MTCFEDVVSPFGAFEDTPTFAYDNNDNMVEELGLDKQGNLKDNRSYSYDFDDRLTRVEIGKEGARTVVEYEYDALGNRTARRQYLLNPQEKRENESVTYYLNDVSGPLTQVLATYDTNINTVEVPLTRRDSATDFGLYYGSRSSISSVVDNTLTCDCFLIPLSLDQIAHPNVSATAKYSTSSGSGDTRLASPQNFLNLLNGMTSTYVNNLFFVSSNTLSFILDLDSISSLCSSNSSNKYMGVNSSNSGCESMNLLVGEFLLKNENKTLASTTNFMGSAYRVFDSSRSILSLTVLFTSLPNRRQSSSVSSLCLNKSSNTLVTASFLNSSDTARSATLDHSTCGNSRLAFSGILTLISAIATTDGKSVVMRLNSFISFTYGALGNRTARRQYLLNPSGRRENESVLRYLNDVSGPLAQVLQTRGAL